MGVFEDIRKTTGDAFSSAVKNGQNAPVDEQAVQAKKFRAQMGDMSQKQYQQAEDTSRRGLAESMSGIKQGASQRGLLYSGLRSGAEANAASGAQSDLAAQRAEINQNLENTAQGMEQGALQSGMQRYGTQLQQSSDTYQQALQKMKDQQAQQAGIMGAAGSVGGMLLGGMPGAFSKKKTAAPQGDENGT